MQFVKTNDDLKVIVSNGFADDGSADASWMLQAHASPFSVRLGSIQLQPLVIQLQPLVKRWML